MAISFVLCTFGAGRHQWDVSLLDGFQILHVSGEKSINDRCEYVLISIDIL